MDVVLIFFFKQKTAYEMRISDWSSDVCSSDLINCSMALVLHQPGPTELNVIPSAENSSERDLSRPIIDGAMVFITTCRSEERRVGKECVSTCRSRWSQYH